jgi:nucleoside-diphosphate-sugar epimerase
MRIFFTGGSGKAGRHVAPFLAVEGHHVTNADLVPLKHPAVADLRVDLTDAGETYSALAGLATFDELDLPEKPTYDAVVHFAAVPRILLTSDAATYATNVLSTYNVLEAATRLGVRKIVFASSETTYGICFAQGERRPLYVPVDEDHPTSPGGRLRDVEGGWRGDGALLPGPHRGGRVRPADQQRHRAARVRRDVPSLPRRPVAAAP